MSGRLTTHVLDISTGKPASHVYIELWVVNEGKQLEKIVESRTNHDGRVDGPLLEGAALKKAVYQLQFHVGTYFKEAQKDMTSFLDIVPIQFTISNENEHYHVPLLIAPGGYSTYRGS